MYGLDLQIIEVMVY